MLRSRWALLAVFAAIAAFATGAATAAPASSVQFVDGKTTLTTDTATTGVLLANKIVPMPVAPGSAKPVWKRGLALKFAFPITGGSANPATLAGDIRHSGGIRFTNAANGKSLLLTDFTIDTVAGQLTAAVNGDPAVRVPILNLGLALNATLGVTFFAQGIKLGTADVAAKIAGKGGHHDDDDDDDDDDEHED
jgi:hypothetical protein